MKTILLLVGILLSLFAQGQDTIVLTSSSEYKVRLQLYKDSLESYNIGKSVCVKLMILFGNIDKKNGSVGVDYNGISHSNNLYFLSGWEYDLKDGQIVDSESLAKFTMLSGPPDFNDGFAEMRDIYKELEKCKVYPYGYVSAGEAPTVYIYRKPIPVSYKAPCFSKNNTHSTSSNYYTILDMTTKFILRPDGKTRLPYISRYYFNRNKLDSIEMLNPISMLKLF